MKDMNGMGLRASVTNDNNSGKMNIEYTKPTESKENHTKQESIKNFMTKITANDDKIEDEIDPVDLDDLNDPQYVVPYVKEIFEYLRNEEVKFYF